MIETIHVQQNDDVYFCDLGISKDEWLELLKDTNMPDEYRDALLRFYYIPEHRGSCTAVSNAIGGDPQSLNSYITKIGQFVQKELNRFQVVHPNGKPCFWIIPMCEGKDLPKGSEGSFEWELRPELVEAIREYLYWYLIERYKEVRKQIPIDSEDWTEIYKWHLITACKGKTPFEIVRDHVAHPSKSELGGFSNLIDAVRDNKTLKHLVDNNPEGLHKALDVLVDESKSLNERLADYKSAMASLLPQSGFNSKANDERTASTILTCLNPEHYTFYKYDVYTLLCKYLGEDRKPAGQCYEHFLSLLKPLSVLAANDKDLQQTVEPSLKGQLRSDLLLAQDVLWILLIEFPEAMGYIHSLLTSPKQRVWLWHKAFLSDSLDTLEIGSSAKTIKDFTPYKSRNALRKAYQQDVGNGDLKIPDAYWLFINEVNIGDIVVIFEPKKGNGKQYHLLHGWGIFTSDCTVNESKDNPMSRTVQWQSFLKIPKQNEEMGNSVFFQETTDKQALHIKELLGINPELIMESKYQKYIDLLETNKNLILTGAPGTGKTFMAKAIAEAMNAEVGFVQFHPSYDYTDFVEGLRPKNDGSGNVGFERKDGVFKEFCKSSIIRTMQNEFKSKTHTTNMTESYTLPRGNSFSEIYDSLENDIKRNVINSLPFRRSLTPVSYNGHRIYFGATRPKSINKSHLEALYNYCLNKKIFDLSTWNREDFFNLISKLTDGNTITLDYINYACMLQEMLRRSINWTSKSSNTPNDKECVSFDEAYDNFVGDLKETGKVLTFERPRSESFKVSVETDSGLRIDGAPIKKELVRSFYDHTNSSNWYSKHCEIIIDYLRKYYGLEGRNGFDDTDDIVVHTHPDIIEPSSKDTPFVFIIDEINRGEISKIFGELFFSIDPGYRGEKGKVNTQYQNMVPEDDVFKDGFYVPENFYIIGTMNDIDRSVESMDFAMRRRFAWQEVTAEESYTNMIEHYPEFALVKDEIKARMFNLNKAIVETEGLDEAYQIGAAYFRKYLDYQEKANAFDCLWENHLKGLLFEYLRGNRRAKELLEKLHNAYNKKSLNE